VEVVETQESSTLVSGAGGKPMDLATNNGDALTVTPVTRAVHRSGLLREHGEAGGDEHQCRRLRADERRHRRNEARSGIDAGLASAGTRGDQLVFCGPEGGPCHPERVVTLPGGGRVADASDRTN